MIENTIFCVRRYVSSFHSLGVSHCEILCAIYRSTWHALVFALLRIYVQFSISDCCGNGNTWMRLLFGCHTNASHVSYSHTFVSHSERTYKHRNIGENISFSTSKQNQRLKQEHHKDLGWPSPCLRTVNGRNARTTKIARFLFRSLCVRVWHECSLIS